MAERICEIEGCDRPFYARGWCEMHYQRWAKHGTPHACETPWRFWIKVDTDGPVPEHRPELGPCWIWMAYRDRRGYGRFRWEDGQTRFAHRWAYIDAYGDPPPELPQLDHLCYRPSCVRPSHLEAVTRKQNMERSEPARRTHCPHGHEYTPENTAYDQGWRKCRTCLRARARETHRRRARERAAAGDTMLA